MENTTEKAKKMKAIMLIKDLCELIGITKKTLYVRIDKGNWKKGEILIINQYKL